MCVSVAAGRQRRSEADPPTAQQRRGVPVGVEAGTSLRGKQKKDISSIPPSYWCVKNLIKTPYYSPGISAKN